MSPTLDARIREALDARAATTTTSADAWARIGRRAAHRNRRRTGIVRLAAAAVVGVVVLGGAVALLARQGGESATVATSTPSGDDTAAAESRTADDGVAESEAPSPDLRVVPADDGSITFLRGEEMLGSVSAAGPRAGARMGEDGTVTFFGIAAAGATHVRLSVTGAPFGGTTATFTDPAAPGLVLFAAEDAILDDFVSWDLVVESLDSAGNVIFVSSNVAGGQ